MSFRALLGKELAWSRRKILALIVVLVLLPAFFAASSLVFQEEIPRDSPVAVVPQSDEVTEDELTIVVGQITFFAEPTVVDSMAAAERKLQREEVYAILSVPPGITDPERSGATFALVVDGSIVAFNEPSTAIRSLLDFHLQDQLPADVSVEREVRGAEATLSEYLFPILLVGTVMLVAFTYLPYVLARESRVLDRVRLESSLERLVGAKLLFFTVLMVVPIVVFHLAGRRVGYDVQSLAPGGIAALLLTFLALAAVSMAIMVATGFGSFGRFVNVVVLFGLLVFSGLVYPIGFFSPLRDAIARSLPTHYAMVVTRSAMLKDVEMELYGDMFVGLVGVALASLIVLELSIVVYRRRA